MAGEALKKKIKDALKIYPTEEDYKHHIDNSVVTEYYDLSNGLDSESIEAQNENDEDHKPC